MFTKDIQTLIKEAIEEEKQIKIDHKFNPYTCQEYEDDPRFAPETIDREYFKGYQEGYKNGYDAQQQIIDNFLVKMMNNGLRQIMEINHEIGAYGVMQNNDPIVRLANENDCLIYKLIVSIRDSKPKPTQKPDTSPESYNIDLSNIDNNEIDIDNEEIELPF